MEIPKKLLAVIAILSFPFGLLMSGRSYESTTQRYLFAGKELQPEWGVYDFGARFYDPSLGRWMSPDPLSDEFPSHSVYNYALNNPIRYIDPDGQAPFEANCCPGGGGGSSIYTRALLSDGVRQEVQQTNQRSTNMFSAKVRVQAFSVGANAQLGPVKVGGKAKALAAEVSTTSSGEASLKVSAVSLSGDAKAGSIGGRTGGQSRQ